MESLGSYLRKLREQRGKSLEEVARETKLQEKFVRALEAEQFEKLPAEVYVKPFLKSYAEFLRIDKNQLYSRYEAQRTPPKSKAAPKTPARENLSPRWVALGAIVAAVMVVLIVLVASDGKESRPSATALGGEASSSAGDGAPREGEPTSPPKQGTGESAVKAAAKDTSTVVAKPPAGEQRMHLQVVASDSSWLEVIGDEDTLYFGFVAGGEEVELEALRRFVVTAGKPEWIQFYLDGKLLALPYSASRTIYQFELDRSRASRYLQNQGERLKDRR